MTDLMSYKGYYGSVHINLDQLFFYGKIEFIRGLITYEGNTAKELSLAFEAAIDDYLNTCKQQNIIPETSFKGSLNVRLGKDLHRKIAIAATRNDVSINSYIKNVLEAVIDTKSKNKPTNIY